MLLSVSLRLIAAGGLGSHPDGKNKAEVRWYTAAGSRGEFNAEKQHMTGVFSCCTGFHIYPNASFQCPDASSFTHRSFDGPLPNMTVDYVMSVCSGCDARGSGVPFNWTAAQAAIPSIVQCADAGNATGLLIDWEPPAHRDKWPRALMTQAAIDFAVFSNKLAVALQAHGRRLGLDLSGDQGSPIDMFSVFGTHAAAVDYFTLMSTYDYFNKSRANSNPYDDYLMVNRALQGGIAAHKLGCGIKTSTVREPNESHWNVSTLATFMHWLSGQGIGAVDVWRWNIDQTWPIDATQPWMLELLDEFIAAGKIHRHRAAAAALKLDDSDHGAGGSEPELLALVAVAGDGFRAPPVPCAAGPWQQSGRLSVAHCNASNDGMYDALPAVQACARMAAACGAILVVPPGKYWLNGSLHLALSTLPSRDGALRVEGIMPAQLCRCHGCIDTRCDPSDIASGSPTVLVGDPSPPSAKGYEGTDGVSLSNLYISGGTTAVRVVNSAGFRMQDVRLGAGHCSNLTLTGGGGGTRGHSYSMAPLVADNSFELSFLRCQFYAACTEHPSVLLRGLPDVPNVTLSRVPYVYIVSFQSCMFVKGGVTYSQQAQLDNVAANDFSFTNCLSEYLATPLLHVVATASVRLFRMELVTIINYEAWDPPAGSSPQPVLSFTGGRATHSLDGVTIINAANIPGKPAIQMNVGHLGGATLLDGHWYGAVDVTGEDASASWLSRSSGGLTFSADESTLTTGRSAAVSTALSLIMLPLHCAALTLDPWIAGWMPMMQELDGHSPHTLLGGFSGEKSARWSLDADGTAQYGDGGSKPWDTQLARPRVIETAWDPHPLSASSRGDSVNVSVPLCEVGDHVQVAHDGLGGAMVLLSAHVARAAMVTVVAMNAGETEVDLPNATLRLLLSRAKAL